MGATAVAVRKGCPMPVPAAPPGSSPVSAGVDVREGDDGGVVFLWGMAAWCWHRDDVAGRRLAAVQLVETEAARPGEVATAFGVDEVTLWRWRRGYAAGGVAALALARPGPRGPSKLNEEKVAEVRRLRAAGLSRDAIAAETGLATGTVSRALAGVPPVEPVKSPALPGGGLEPLARPEPRYQERQAARRGELDEAEPRITPGASLPLAGALVILPALAVTGVLECFEATYGRAKAAFYGLRSLVLTVVFAALLGEPRAEGLTRIDPVDIGRLLGLDRAPEPKTLRRRLEALAGEHKADRLLGGMARRHAAAHDEAMGVLYVDGHVRAYHGKADIPKAHVARIRLSMPAEVDTWVADANGDGLLVWQAPPGASLVSELRRVAVEVRALVGPDRRPTIAFDRGGWSPTLFAELVAAGFEILTYRKAPCVPEPRNAFTLRTFTDRGRTQEYWLADRAVRISYKVKNKTKRFACRQITRLDPATGHQTQVLTTRSDPDPAPLAYAMFSRWRQENFFRYLRARYALDALDSYATTNDDPARMTPNPARRDADRELRDARRQLGECEAAEGKASIDGRRPSPELLNAFAAAGAEVDRRAQTAKAIPAKLPLSDVRPDAQRLAPERKRIHDAIRMATYNAESALTRVLAPHYPRAHDEARSLLREIFGSPADIQINGNELHVRIHPLSAPRRTRALAGLCADLTATNTTYPGTDLTLIYTVKQR